MSYAADFDRVTHTPKTIGTATTAIVLANTKRRYLLLQNNGNEAIYIKLGVAAVLNEGIKLNPNGSVGDTFEISCGEENLYKGAVNGICTTGGKLLLVTEGE